MVYYGALVPKVVVYIKEADWKNLEREGQDPAKWVRGLIARAFEKRNEK